MVESEVESWPEGGLDLTKVAATLSVPGEGNKSDGTDLVPIVHYQLGITTESAAIVADIDGYGPRRIICKFERKLVLVDREETTERQKRELTEQEVQKGGITLLVAIVGPPNDRLHLLLTRNVGFPRKRTLRKHLLHQQVPLRVLEHLLGHHFYHQLKPYISFHRPQNGSCCEYGGPSLSKKAVHGGGIGLKLKALGRS